MSSYSRLFTHFRSTNQYTNNHNCTHTISFSNAASPFRTFRSPPPLIVLYKSVLFDVIATRPLELLTYMFSVSEYSHLLTRTIQTGPSMCRQSAQELSFVEPLEFIKTRTNTSRGATNGTVGQMQINFHEFHRMRLTNPNRSPAPIHLHCAALLLSLHATYA